MLLLEARPGDRSLEKQGPELEAFLLPHLPEMRRTFVFEHRGQQLEKVQALTERWSDQASDQLQAVTGELEAARQRVAASSANAFQGSRFAFVNAMINRILD